MPAASNASTHGEVSLITSFAVTAGIVGLKTGIVVGVWEISAKRLYLVSYLVCISGNGALAYLAADYEAFKQLSLEILYYSALGLLASFLSPLAFHIFLNKYVIGYRRGSADKCNASGRPSVNDALRLFASATTRMARAVLQYGARRSLFEATFSNLGELREPSLLRLENGLNRNNRCHDNALCQDA